MAHHTEAANTPDEGSMALALMVAVVITTISIALIGSSMVSIQKSRDSRDIDVSRHAADTALADATLHANLGKFDPTDGTAATTNTGKLGAFTWKWTATPIRRNEATLDITITTPQRKNRTFAATLTGTRVESATETVVDGNPHITYKSSTRDRQFVNGFHSVTGWSTLTGRTVDTKGINGAKGLVSTEAPTNNFTNITSDLVDIWNWAPTDTIAGRCAGGPCTKPSKVRAQTGRPGVEPPIPASTVCATAAIKPAWTASSGTPLESGKCYASLTFNTNYAVPQVSGTAQELSIYTTGDVRVGTSRDINVDADGKHKAKNLRIYMVGAARTFTLETQGRFVGAVHNPTGTCSSTGTTTSLNTWIGAGYCHRMDISSASRLRFDGGLTRLTDDNSAVGPAIWAVKNYRAR